MINSYNKHLYIWYRGLCYWQTTTGAVSVIVLTETKPVLGVD